LASPGFITSPICLSSFITVEIGVPMSSWPMAAPKMMRNSFGWLSVARLPWCMT
jgi:hypothetical protein